MKKFAIAILAMATALAIAPAALADQIAVAAGNGVSYSATGGVTAGTGTVSGTPNTTGAFAVLIGDAVNFYAWGPSTTGVAFTTDGGLATFTIDTISLFNVISVNSLGGTSLSAAGTGMFDDDGMNYPVDWTSSGNTVNGSSYGFSMTADTTVTPEPSSLLLLGTGFLGLAFVVFRKAKPSSPALKLSL